MCEAMCSPRQVTPLGGRDNWVQGGPIFKLLSMTGISLNLNNLNYILSYAFWRRQTSGHTKRHFLLQTNITLWRVGVKIFRAVGKHEDDWNFVARDVPRMPLIYLTYLPTYSTFSCSSVKFNNIRGKFMCQMNFDWLPVSMTNESRDGMYGTYLESAPLSRNPLRRPRSQSISWSRQLSEQREKLILNYIEGMSTHVPSSSSKNKWAFEIICNSLLFEIYNNLST